MEYDTIKYYTQEELRQIFRTIEKMKKRHWIRDLTLIRIAYRCALRASECSLITLGNYNKVKEELFCKRLKGSWSNTIRLDGETSKLLNKYIKLYNITNADSVLFRSQEGTPISRKSLDYIMKFYCTAAKIQDKSKHHFHVLKHSAAVHFAESGLDIKDINFLLGHKNINNTMVYFRYTTAQQSQLYKKLEKNNAMV